MSLARVRRGSPVRRLIAGLALVVTVLGGCSTSPLHRSPAPPSSHSGGTVGALPAGTVVAFLGDSYTAGQGASSAAHRWTSVLCARHGWVERNFGVGGSGYLAGSPYASRVKALADAHPSLVIVSGGVNDLGVAAYSPPAEGGAIDTTLAGLRQVLPHAVIVVLRPFFPTGNPPAVLDAIAVQERTAAPMFGAAYVDEGSPLTGRPDALAADHLHPNDTGHELVARAVDGALARTSLPSR